ncbi:hypothetical protein KUTeg_022535 [Tegillarca granosa]|uniref:P2X purinoreceptor 7 intracellular domain-containing protein n=1 Tax=Tegillarca granosa TaxID=220873 RepID=A0ABQ9EB27_TEGGR|nr:hypothetical protein KUTeg_022535 [Tegillarca granosa]
MERYIESSSEEEIPEIDLTLRIQPYMYEPTRNTVVGDGSSSDSSIPTSDSETDDENNRRLQDKYWCDCGNCEIMTTVAECKCCFEVNIVDGKRESANLTCITQHQMFIDNCLNRNVLELAVYDYKHDVGPLPENNLPHETYRYLAYRRFVRWIWKIVGRRNRRILPSCVVNKIRESFPSEEFCGFKYPV